jgi:hypothetical protein
MQLVKGLTMTPAKPNPGNGTWEHNRLHVLAELRRMAEWIQSIDKRVRVCEGELKGLAGKCAAFAALGGFAAMVLSHVVSWLKG